MTDYTVIQAEARGVTDNHTLMSVAPGGSLAFVRPPAAVEPSRMIEFARGEIGRRYGFLTIVSVAFDLLTPLWLRFPIRRPGTWICSALANMALTEGGWVHHWADVYQVTPAQLMHALLDSGGTVVSPAEVQSGDVGFAHSRGFVSGAIRLGQRLGREQDWQVNHAFIVDRKVAP